MEAREQIQATDSILMQLLQEVRSLRAAQGIVNSAWYTYQQAAELSQHSIISVKRAVAAGKLATNNGTEPRIAGDELTRWIKEGCRTGRSLATM